MVGQGWANKMANKGYDFPPTKKNKIEKQNKIVASRVQSKGGDDKYKLHLCVSTFVDTSLMYPLHYQKTCFRKFVGQNVI